MFENDIVTPVIIALVFVAAFFVFNLGWSVWWLLLPLAPLALIGIGGAVLVIAWTLGGSH